MPLQGVRVIELGGLIAGPYAASLFAQFGAEVIKVEAPGEGDPLRTWRKLHNGTSLWWYSLSRNKKSITLNLKSEKGRRIVRALVEKADVVIENFRPGHARGVGARLGRSLADQSRAGARPHLRLRAGRSVSRPPGLRARLPKPSAACAIVTGYPDRAPVRVGRQPRRHAGGAVRGDRRAHRAAPPQRQRRQGAGRGRGAVRGGVRA